jgi:hypothetical protein
MSTVEIISKEKLLQARNVLNIKKNTFFLHAKKEKEVEVEIVNGEIQNFKFDRPVGEMITSSDTAEGFLAKITLDLEMGFAEIPLLYKDIYETIENRDFPKVFEGKWLQYGKVVFLQHVEGQEVKFGVLESEEGDVAYIRTYSAGFEYTEDLIEYNMGWSIELLNKSMGRAYNALLNHVYLYPIISYSYTSANQTPANTMFDSPAYADVDGYTKHVLNIRQTLIDAKQATLEKDSYGKNRAGSTIILCSSTDEQYITEALNGFTVRGTVYQPLTGISKIIVYDGWSETVKGETTSYTGVTAGTCYLIKPKTYMKELIKHGLIVDSDNADLSRLIEQQIIGRSRIGVYAGIANSVEEITLPDIPEAS